MRPFICRSCRATLQQVRNYSNSTTQLPKTPAPSQNPENDIDTLLGPDSGTWSVRSLLPLEKHVSPPNIPAVDGSRPKSEAITTKQLEHLLRLSALPLPQKASEQTKMLEILESQLHFMRAIREVDTEGVEPLVQLRDETEEGTQEITVGLEQLKDALSLEEIIGRNRRPRRSRGVASGPEVVRNEKSQNLEESDAESGSWDVLGTAKEIVGRYFVVRSGKPGQVGNIAPNIFAKIPVEAETLAKTIENTRSSE